MDILKTEIEDVLLLRPSIHADSRGYFFESYNKILLSRMNLEVNFVQDNESKSGHGILRGLHFQLPPYAQSKLVRVLSGSVLDIAVDIRQGSPSFGQNVTVELSEDNKHQLFIPQGFAHGFVVLSESATFAYKVDNYYSPECDRGVAFDDDQLNIDWQLPKTSLQLSSKDSQQPLLAELPKAFDYHTDYYA